MGGSEHSDDISTYTQVFTRQFETMSYNLEVSSDAIESTFSPRLGSLAEFLAAVLLLLFFFCYVF